MPEITVELPARDAASGDAHAAVGLVIIDRERVLNALDDATMAELADALTELDADDGCRAIVITGAGERAFAAGADIREMADLDADAVRRSGRFERWDAIAAVRTPTIAAVRGFALGGGLELALACDIIIAADDATFGQPEVRIGIIPGVGGTQRLTRTIGKARAMDMILTGRHVSATEAAEWGIASRLVPSADVVGTALGVADAIVAAAPLAVRAAQEAVDGAGDGTLGEGIAAERVACAELFDTDDQAEGMRAFLDKRPPEWKGR